MKILFLIPYPLNESPSQRFRFEQYFSALRQRGYTYHTQSFLESHSWHFFFKSGNLAGKLAALLKGFLRRFLILFALQKYDLVFIHREVTPIGPPVFEFVIARLLKKKVIYDFDDAIWLTDRKDESWLLRTLKHRKKVDSIIRWSFRVSCGNEYLCSHARPINPHVILNPTTIDTKNLHNPALFKRNENSLNALTIGWTGSHSTIKYLKQLEPVLRIIKSEYPYINFSVIADKDPALNVPSSKFIKWSHANEVSELFQFDIGLMPLPDDEWAKGKCGFKALQYMAMRIPTIASPVGVNTTIISDGNNGFLAQKEEEWLSALRKLITDRALREAMGERARKTVEKNYSVDSNTETFLALFEM